MIMTRRHEVQAGAALMARLSNSAPPGIMELYNALQEHYRATGRRATDGRAETLNAAERQRIVNEAKVSLVCLQMDLERIMGGR
ncbi:hypothetical protein [Brevibacillus sp. NRS-1366]|uniref:hypothetical protein n=1 Tax=Brevibacillus sp. NRS-1366 TaxID=3233899 RepID=UPI003D1F089D